MFQTQHDADMSLLILKLDHETYRAIQNEDGGIVSLFGEPCFGDSAPCDNTFTSHEDYDEYTFSRVDNLQLDASFVETFGDEIEGFVDYHNVALRNMEMSNFHTVCSIKL